MNFKNKKLLFWIKGHWVKHQLQVFTLGISMCEGVGDDSC